MSPLGAAALEHVLTIGRAHANAETVRLVALAGIGLESAFHVAGSWSESKKGVRQRSPKARNEKDTLRNLSWGLEGPGFGRLVLRGEQEGNIAGSVQDAEDVDIVIWIR
jgi:hypothetical protein